jgi:hypothetical protein
MALNDDNLLSLREALKSHHPEPCQAESVTSGSS